MTSDTFLAVMCAVMLALLFGSTLAFSGYRFFIFLLPIWGFFWGFGLGAQSIQAIFNEGFLSSITSWVVGFFLGLLFAVLSYFFFAGAVAILAGGLGYAVGVGLMGAIGFEMGFITWLVGMAVAVLFVIGVFVLDLYKWAIIIATSVWGALIIVGAFLLAFGRLPTSELVADPVRAVMNGSFWWWFVGVTVAILGIAIQYQSTRNWTLRAYNRIDEVYPTTTPDTSFMDSPVGQPSNTAGMSQAVAGASPSGGVATTPAADVPPAADSSNQPPTGTGTTT